MKNVPKPSKKAVCLPGANLASMELTRTQLREPGLDFSAFQESLRIQGVLAGSGQALGRPLLSLVLAIEQTGQGCRS